MLCELHTNSGKKHAHGTDNVRGVSTARRWVLPPAAARVAKVRRAGIIVETRR
jgi:hypothetical protein